MGYLSTHDKKECFSCEACAQVCSRKAISMVEDEEGFRYPQIDAAKCVSCGKCHSICPHEDPPGAKQLPQYVFGGGHIDPCVRQASTSGGVFSAIVDAWCDKDYVVFGTAADGLRVFHCYVTEKDATVRFRKSKYAQSVIGNSYIQAKTFLREGKKVLFSGTPCQIAGLKAFLRGENQEGLLTVEVICEGVPSPLFMRSYDKELQERYGSRIKTIDYRDKDGNKWDFEVMSTSLESGHHFKIDRWFNPFWSIWLGHLMSRPCCYECPYAGPERIADITLGDLWGVHLYCPELYSRNSGASLVLCNTERGRRAMALAEPLLLGHELEFDIAIKYQSPLRKPIDKNPQRDAFMRDLLTLPYQELCRKWAKKPTLKLLWSKYVWGNRQKVFLWNVSKKISKAFR